MCIHIIRHKIYCVYHNTEKYQMCVILEQILEKKNPIKIQNLVKKVLLTYQTA